MPNMLKKSKLGFWPNPTCGHIVQCTLQQMYRKNTFFQCAKIIIIEQKIVHAQLLFYLPTHNTVGTRQDARTGTAYTLRVYHNFA